jgi:hypothetical protein
MLITHPTLLETITCIFSSENNFNRWASFTSHSLADWC